MPKKSAPAFESWGRYPRCQADLVPIHWQQEFPPALAREKMLPVGLGRSYGDVCLLEGGTLLGARALDRFLAFDAATGVLRCEAGVSFAEILELAVPRGWFLPVTPGTKFVTVGGAIANDIHGKNHHVAGSFGRHVRQFELVRSNGTRRICSPTQHPDWFEATVGGCGLTGFIPWAEIQMRPIVSPRIDYEGIQFHGIDELLALFEAAREVEYTVAWIDCVSSGANFARGIMMQGTHAAEPEPLVTGKSGGIPFPVDLPEVFLNRLTMRAFNELYFRRQLRPRVRSRPHYEPFFYPLDSIEHWNRMYGRKGLLQFQCALPWEGGREGMIELLRAITRSGLASFLAVLKTFGDIPSPGLLSFPMPGLMLALDFPIRDEVSFELVDRLEDITAEYGGRLYSAKDARMKPKHFQRFYPRWQQFAGYIDPAFDSAYWQRVSARV